MVYTELTAKAMVLAYDKHKNQLDKSKIPYIYHPIHIAEKMDDEASTIVALLHDVLEDTNTTIDELKKYNFSKEVLEALVVITKLEDEDYFSYINRVKMNKLARKVKLADLKHNSDIKRIINPTEKDRLRVEKYLKALSILKQENINETVVE